eukprot:4326055-Amphidinium_carterae.2
MQKSQKANQNIARFSLATHINVLAICSSCQQNRLLDLQSNVRTTKCSPNPVLALHDFGRTRLVCHVQTLFTLWTVLPRFLERSHSRRTDDFSIWAFMLNPMARDKLRQRSFNYEYLTEWCVAEFEHVKQSRP